MAYIIDGYDDNINDTDTKNSTNEFYPEDYDYDNKDESAVLPPDYDYNDDFNPLSQKENNTEIGHYIFNDKILKKLNQTKHNLKYFGHNIGQSFSGEAAPFSITGTVIGGVISIICILKEVIMKTRYEGYNVLGGHSTKYPTMWKVLAGISYALALPSLPLSGYLSSYGLYKLIHGE